MGVLLLAGGSPTAGALAPIPWIVLSPEPSVEAEPGSFATGSVRVLNPSEEPVELILRVTPPEGWRALTAERVILMAGGAEETVPFTAWVPPWARARTPYSICVRAEDPGGSRSAIETALELRVAPRTGLRIEAAAADVRVCPGEDARHLVHMRNSGNCACLVTWDVGSIPEWRFDQSTGPVRLEPGTAAWLELTVRVPPEAPSGAVHLLDLAVTARPVEATAPPVTERAQLRTLVLAPRAAPGRHAALPIEAAVSVGEIAPGASSRGLRLATRGEVVEGGEFEAELDLVAGERAHGVEGWQRQHWFVGLSRGAWNARAGDVVTSFPDVVVQTTTLRGGSFEIERPFGALRVLAGRNRTARPTASWGLGLSRSISPRDRLSGDFVLREEDALGAGIRRTHLFCVSGVRRWSGKTTLRLETALSNSSLGSEDRRGTAAQLFYDHLGVRLQARGRGYFGSDGYSGRTRDRDGASGYLLYLPHAELRLWSSLDAARGRIWPEGDSPSTRSVRYRAGARYARLEWPALELTVSGDHDRAQFPDSLRDLDRRALGITLSRSVGSILTSASGYWGTVRNARTERSGATRSLDLVCGGRVASVRTALQFQRTEDWNPEVSGRLETTNWTGDLAWSSHAGRVQAGLALSSRQVISHAEGGAARRDHRLGPRLDLGLRRMLRLRLDASLLGFDGAPKLDRWQVQLSYSGSESMPLPWRPLRGEVHGVVFVDTDGDGEPGATEERVQGVVLRVDGRTLVTDERGLFELPALEPGGYWLDLNRGSLPPALVPREPLPIEVRIEPGDERWIRVALVPSGTISGRVFLDADHDGKPGRDETGVRDLRVLLVQGETRVADGLTDAAGRYRMSEVPPGAYEIRIADGWLPDGWIVTSGVSLAVTVGPGENEVAPPYGLAPRPRSIIRTYQGGSR